MVVAGIPERDWRARLIRHSVRVANQLDVSAEGIFEIVDRLPRGRALRQRYGTEQLRSGFRLQVFDALVDVAGVEGNVVGTPVGVLPKGLILVGRGVLEEFDVRPVAAAKHADLLHNRARIDVDEVGHESADRIAERAERERVDKAKVLLEPRRRHIDVRDGDTDVVDADQTRHAGHDRVHPIQLR